MTNEDKTFELMTKMYAEFSQKFENIEGEIGDLKGEMGELKGTVSSMDKTLIKIENEHGGKLSALFDGWKQNTDQLQRIEKEVSRQNEVILSRIK
jgi:uncharacterized protein YukE